MTMTPQGTPPIPTPTPEALPVPTLTTEAPVPAAPEDAALGTEQYVVLTVVMLVCVGAFRWGWTHRNQADSRTAYIAMAAGFVLGVATLVVFWLLATHSR